MKKTLVAIAALTAIAASAQTTTGKPGFEIQGNFNAGFGQISYKGVSNAVGIEQNGAGTTQINFRGLEDLGGGNQAYFRVENDLSIVRNDANQGVITDVGNGAPQASSVANFTAGRTQKGATSTFGNGELAVGVRGAFGDVAFGAINNAGLTNFVLIASPLQGTSYGSGYGSIIGADPTLGSVRWNNSFKYATPTMNGFTAQFIYSAKQTNAKHNYNAQGIAGVTVNTGLGANDQIGAKELGLKYANGPLTVGAVSAQTDSTDAAFCGALNNSDAVFTPGYNRPCYVAASTTTGVYNTQSPNAGFKSTQNSLAAKYELGNGFTVSGGMQQTKWKEIVAGDGDQADRSAQIATLTYVTGVHTVFGTYGTMKEKAARNAFTGKTSTMTAVGYNYALSKTSNLYGRYETLTDDAGSQAAVWGGAAPTVSLIGTDSTNKRTRTQLGLMVNF